MGCSCDARLRRIRRATARRNASTPSSTFGLGRRRGRRVSKRNLQHAAASGVDGRVGVSRREHDRNDAPCDRRHEDCRAEPDDWLAEPRFRRARPRHVSAQRPPPGAIAHRPTPQRGARSLRPAARATQASHRCDLGDRRRDVGAVTAVKPDTIGEVRRADCRAALCRRHRGKARNSRTEACRAARGASPLACRKG